MLPNRHGSTDSYRYGFQGQEKDDEVKGEGNSYDFGARMYDPRIGRWFRTDPLEFSSPELSPYNFAANSPIVLIDPDGEKEKPFVKGKSKPITRVKGTDTPLYIYGVIGGKVTPIKYHPMARNAYNCHSYAWHKSQGDSKNNSKVPNDPNAPKWDNDPSDDIYEQNATQLHKDVRNKVGDKVIYYQDINGDGKWQYGEEIAHSAIVEKVDKEGYTEIVKGKMGAGEEASNHPNAPGYYETHDFKPTGNKLSRAYFRVGANLQKVGNITFDSNAARKATDNSGNNYLIVQDVNTGKDYGVIRNSDGSYDFKRKNKTNTPNP